MKKIFTLLVMISFAQFINAQNIQSYTETKNLVFLKYGIEPTYVLGVGYMHVFDVHKINRPIGLYGEISGPVKIFGLQNYEMKIGGIIPLLKTKRFNVNYSTNFSTGHVKTKNFNAQKFAYSNKLLIGVFKKKSYVAFSAEHENIISNKIVHTPYYREYIYPEAKDGWYKGAGGSIQLGVEFGFTFKESFDLNFDLKVPKSEKFNSYNGSPGHVNLLLGYRF